MAQKLIEGRKGKKSSIMSPVKGMVGKRKMKGRR